MSENAAMPYQPTDEQTPSSRIQAALAKAQSQLSSRPGVKGMGMTQTAAGQDAIVVYVENAKAISQLPTNVDGYSVIGEVTGDISAY